MWVWRKIEALLLQLSICKVISWWLWQLMLKIICSVTPLFVSESIWSIGTLEHSRLFQCIQYMVQREVFIVLNKYFGHFQTHLEKITLKRIGCFILNELGSILWIRILRSSVLSQRFIWTVFYKFKTYRLIRAKRGVESNPICLERLKRVELTM